MRDKRLVTWLVGVVTILGGTEGGLSLLEGHWASLPHLFGAVLLLFVVYSILPQKEPE